MLAFTSPTDAGDTDALRDLKAKAEKGETAAPLALAVRYGDGKDVEKNNALALQWAHRAADAGNAEAINFVGSTYLRGAVVPQSPGIAFAYVKEAAEQSAGAAFNPGQCYFGAQGTAQDIPKALK